MFKFFRDVVLLPHIDVYIYVKSSANGLYHLEAVLDKNKQHISHLILLAVAAVIG